MYISRKFHLVLSILGMMVDNLVKGWEGSL